MSLTAEEKVFREDVGASSCASFSMGTHPSRLDGEDSLSSLSSSFNHLPFLTIDASGPYEDMKAAKTTAETETFFEQAFAGFKQPSGPDKPQLVLKQSPRSPRTRPVKDGF